MSAAGGRARTVVTHLPDAGATVISRWVFNCIVVHDRGDGRPFVVDLGLPSHVAEVRAVLHGLGGDLADLGAVVATHGHTDHVAGIPTLATSTPTAVPVLLPQTVAGFLDGTTPLRSPGPREIARILPVLADQPRDLGALRDLAPLTKEIGYDGRAIRMPLEEPGWLADGDRLPGAPAWEVVHAPGHTDDSTCLYHEPTRTLISGDAVLSVGGRAWCNPEKVDPERSAATEDRLRALDVDHLLPGHGRPLTGRALTADALSFRDRPPRSGALRMLWDVASDRAGRHLHR